MSLKEKILEKVPDYLKKEPEFKALLEHIKIQNIQEKEGLLTYLKEEIKSVERWLEEHRGEEGAFVKELRDKAVRLSVLKKCEGMVGEFLF